MDNRIDVIIPAYNAHATLFRCLASIAALKLAGEIDVTIVDDCSDHGYDDITVLFKDYLNILVLRLDTNTGPGHAREYGRMHTKNPLITFIDADDTFNGTLSLYLLRLNLLLDPKSCCCIGTFLEEQGDMYIPHVNDTVWMFGKMYRRVFLDKYNIHMNDTRSNEDTGFNTLIKLYGNEDEQIKFINDIVYIWHATEDSITRINNCDYSFNASFDGYTDNMIWAIAEVKKRFPFRENYNYFIVEVLCNLYFYYMETILHKPQYIEKNFKACKRFYESTYKEIEPHVTPEILAANYNLMLRNFVNSNRCNGFICSLSIQQFLSSLREGSEVTES